MAIEVFDDRRVCDKCDKVFLYRNEITENIEGMFNPTINDDIYEGIYCFRCIQLLEEQN